MTPLDTCFFEDMEMYSKDMDCDDIKKCQMGGYQSEYICQGTALCGTNGPPGTECECNNGTEIGIVYLYNKLDRPACGY